MMIDNSQTEVVQYSDNFNYAVEHVLNNEGGYADVPGDQGGPTNFGITLYTLRLFMGDKKLTAKDVRDLPLETAVKIYKVHFWDRIDGDKITSKATGALLLDCAVLYGVNACIVMAQKTLFRFDKRMRIDGIMGPRTLEILNQVDDKLFALEFVKNVKIRIDRIVEINPINKKFKLGWENRADRLLSLN